MYMIPTGTYGRHNKVLHKDREEEVTSSVMSGKGA